MFRKNKQAARNQLILSACLTIIGLVSVAFLAINVVSDLRLLRSASSDNVQWTLSQTEVEFLEFEIKLEESVRQPVPDLAPLRRSFDIFYSRISTLRQASIYAPVRELPEFSSNLKAIQSFLESTVTQIDAADPALTAALPKLATQASDVRANVRRLSNSGLNYFATESDKRRDNVSVTLQQLAIGVSVLLVALVLLALYLGHLNRINIRRSSQAIQASKRMNIVTSTALDAVVVCDDNGQILDFNEAAQQIFGYTAEQALGNELGELIVPDHHREAHNAGMQRMRDSGEKRVVGKGRIKLEAKRSNGELFPVEFAIQSAETDEGEIFISFLRDISHRIAAEQDLVAARDRALAGEKAKTDFLATMSHEIRTPLNGLLGNLTLLGDTRLSGAQGRYIKNMETSGKLLMSHISDVLDITKYDAGKLTLRPVSMNISTLLQDIVDNQSGAASANNTVLEWGWFGEKLDWIYADKERIQHILMNLIGNAVKFTHGGRVSVKAQIVRVSDSEPEIKIAVKDTGTGISDGLKTQIFDDFKTGDASYDRDVGGTGLGLGIARRFVTALGGQIDVESQEGQGSTFTVRFPIEPTDASWDSDGKDSFVDTTRPCHVLLVEDNEINRTVAREMLRAAGHQVTEAHNGKIAVELSQEQKFDLILMDISMPVMDGRVATRNIRTLAGPSQSTPIIALTANAMAEEQEAFLEDGMNDILIKPLSRDGLLQVLSQHAGTSLQRSVAQPHNQHLQELQEVLGVEALQPLLNGFIAEMEETLMHLKNSAQHQNPDIVKTAHKAAGSAAYLGATELRQALLDVEQAAKRDEGTAVAQAVQALPHVWASTKPMLRVQP